MNLWTLTVKAEFDGSRLDIVLSRLGDHSRNAVQRLIIENLVMVNGKTARKNDRVSEGDTVVVSLPEPVASEALPEDIPLNILYEDRDILVINKPQGLVVHPSPGHEQGTLVNALLYHCQAELSGIGGVQRPGIVHRIDKDTSGLLVVAKNDFAHTALSADLKKHDVKRIYECIVLGNPKQDSFTVNAPLARHPNDRKKQAVVVGGRESVTHAAVLERFNRHAYVRCELETGRTHQIRVHLAHVGHPILGDTVYGGDNKQWDVKIPLSGQCLHAVQLTLKHPRSGEILTFSSELPLEMQAVLAKLRS